MLLEKQTQFDYSSLGIFEHRFQWNKKRRVEAIIHQKEYIFFQIKKPFEP